jgi:hypothetical protein
MVTTSLLVLPYAGFSAQLGHGAQAAKGASKAAVAGFTAAHSAVRPDATRGATAEKRRAATRPMFHPDPDPPAS